MVNAEDMTFRLADWPVAELANTRVVKDIQEVAIVGVVIGRRSCDMQCVHL